MKEPKEIADKYFDKYIKLNDSTNRIALITILVLIANWLLIVEPNFSTYKKQKVYFTKQFTILDERISKLPAIDANVEERDSLIARKHELKKEKDESLQEKVSQVNDLPSLIKFVFFISADRETGGVILSAILFLLCMYLFATRRALLKNVSKAIRIYKVEPDLKINKYQDFSLPSSFWLAPLPQIPNKDLLPGELRIVLGWSYNYRYYSLITLLGLATALLIETRLAYVTFIVNERQLNVLFFISCILVLLFGLLIYFWFLPIKIEDNFNTEDNPNPLSRRDFITMSVFGIFAVGIFTLPNFILPYTYKRPQTARRNLKKANRFKGRLAHTNTLVQNCKTGIVHYVNNDGCSLAFKTIQSANQFENFNRNLAPFNDIPNLQWTKEQQQRLPILFSSWNSECFAKSSIADGAILAAVTVLLCGIKQTMARQKSDASRLSYSLFDLLAKTYIKHKSELDPQIWNQLLELAEKSDDQILRERITKWKTLGWQTKILNQKNVNVVTPTA